ncbi:hypothetical protein ACFCW2_02760 [Qipengyuania sp. DSG2-2]|uniref:hypothetical protein n=1 Tax=Qipengyuania sp. DGS2-2 TaxID=3349631 RepID=UPI0036D26636
MATIADDARVTGRGELQDTRFFLIMAVVMSLLIVAGFVVNLAAGRSSFDVPAAYHVHGVVFMGWIGIYLGQHATIHAGARDWHIRLGKLAYLWVPLMALTGTWVMLVVAQRTGGPFFFHKSEFLFSNLAVLWCFAGLAWWALKRRRYTGWHRRLMLCAMAVLLGPGIGRLLPMPLMIPNAWLITQIITFLFPVIGMIADKRARGAVHPAYWWGLGIYVAVFTVSMVLAYSPFGIALTESYLAGTPGAQRPMEAFLPPGFTM